MTEANTPAPKDENQIIAERRAKLAELRKAGNAFPNDFQRLHMADALHAAHGDQSKEALEAIAGSNDAAQVASITVAVWWRRMAPASLKGRNRAAASSKYSRPSR